MKIEAQTAAIAVNTARHVVIYYAEMYQVKMKQVIIFALINLTQHQACISKGEQILAGNFLNNNIIHWLISYISWFLGYYRVRYIINVRNAIKAVVPTMM